MCDVWRLVGLVLMFFAVNTVVRCNLISQGVCLKLPTVLLAAPFAHRRLLRTDKSRAQKSYSMYATSPIRRWFLYVRVLGCQDHALLRRFDSLTTTKGRFGTSHSARMMTTRCRAWWRIQLAFVHFTWPLTWACTAVLKPILPLAAI